MTKLAVILFSSQCRIGNKFYVLNIILFALSKVAAKSSNFFECSQIL